MPRVRPGYETGIYYVILAGIGWDVDWHDLKDFVRANGSGPLIEVDYAEVYKNGGGGYVRLLGLINFRKAFNLLNGATIKNHTLIADGRNETMEATILNSPSDAREPEVQGQSQEYLPQRQDHTLSPMLPLFSGSQQTSEWASPQTHTSVTNMSAFPTPYSQVQYAQPLSTNYSFGTAFPIQPTVTYYPVNFPGLVAVNSISIHAPMQSRLPDMHYATPLPSVLPETYFPRQQQQLNQAPVSTVEIEARKVIMTHLARTVAEQELHDLLSSVLQNGIAESMYDHPVHSIELPRHSDGSLKGHAFILFETYSHAKVVVDNLDGYIFHGRPLKVRLAKEGAEPSHRQSAPTRTQTSADDNSSNRKPIESPATSSMTHNNSKHSCSRRSSGDKHYGSSSSSHTGTRNAHYKATKPKTTEKVVESPPSRKTCATPVVADGSFGGRSHSRSERHRK